MTNPGAGLYKINRYLEQVLTANCITFLFVTLLAAILCFHNPRGFTFLGALIPIKIYSFVPYGLIVVLFHAYLISVIALNLVVTTSLLIVILLHFTLLITQEIRLGKRTYFTNDTLRIPANLMIAYRGFQLLRMLYMQVLGPWMLFFHMALSFGQMYAFSVILRFADTLSAVAFTVMLLTTLAGMCFWMALLQFGSYLCVKGGKTRNSWKQISFQKSWESRIFAKFRLSCSPLLISYGSIFKIVRITPFMYVKGVIRGTVKFLIALK